MALSCEKETPNDVWFLDSGCSNHMSGTKSLFKDLDESKKSDVRLGDNKKVQVEGEGTVSIMISQGNTKILEDVMFVPSLSHNLLSIEQLMISGYSISFDDGVCTIKNKKFGKTIAKVPMTNNKMFPLEVSMVEKCVMDCMMKNFEMSDLGLLHYFLGLEVKQGIDGIFLSQRKYATDLLKKFTMVNCKVATTPMNINEKLCRDDGSEMANATYFRSLVGGLNYLSHTRPDIAFSVGVISRFMHNPSKLHLGAAKRVLRYIAGTTEHGIWYSKATNFTLTGFTDSDYAGNIDDRKSTSGFLFNLGSGAISWSSKKQEIVSLSTSEAEYIAATSAACQAVWLRRLLADFNQKPAGVTKIFCDNISAIAMTNKQHYTVEQSRSR
uniref:Uncharacterized protein n=1 Tax=Solanum lycopersicum TaxID=4081 RepID=A0A3Q7HIM5_SOLLC